MKFVSGTEAALQSALMADMARYRHKVFVERLGWQLQCQDGLEFDQFDREDTVYVVAQSTDGELIGTARLLPTTRPYLLGEVFPQLLDGRPIPCDPGIWELSRFSAVDLRSSTTPAFGLSSDIAVGLLRASIECAKARGATKLVSVSPLGVERLLNRVGIHWTRIGRPVPTESGSIVAGYVEMQR